METDSLLAHARRGGALTPIDIRQENPNSMSNFAHSFTRAQLFAALLVDNEIHRQRSFFDPDNLVFEDELVDPDLYIPLVRGERLLMISRRSLAILRFTKEVDGVVKMLGQSTAPQTIFNSINVLIGVGLLALPVGIYKAGWVFGVPILVACCLTTYWTASLLSKAMDTDPTIMTYADLGYASYGAAVKLLISLIFSIDLLGLGVALVILFSDSLSGLFTGYSLAQFKLVALVVLTPFTFMPLRVLSFFSLLGILSTITITGLVIVCGFLKPSAPGSLVEVMPTNLYPALIMDLLVGIGILMAPFGGHAIFPNLKSDMRHPHKFEWTLKVTYFITLLTDCSMGIVGFLMFGPLCNNEVTNNILTTAGYPSWMYPLITGLLCLVPLAKTPLNATPIITTLELVAFSTGTWLGAMKKVILVMIKIGVNAAFVALALCFPEFDKIIGMLGALICFLVCIVLPGLFYLKLCRPTKAKRQVITVVVCVAVFLGVVCTAAVLMD